MGRATLRHLAFILVALTCWCCVGTSDARAEPPPSAFSKPAVPQASPTKVALGFYVMSARSVDLKEQSFYADFYMWMRFTPLNEEQAKEILEKAEFMNGTIDSKEEVERKQVGAETYACWRMRGTFHFTAELHNYPFDTQVLTIALENSNLEADEMIYVDDTQSYARSGAPALLAGVKSDLQVPEYHLRRVERVASASTYRSDFGDPTREQAESKYSRFTLTLGFERDFWPYVFKIVIPLVVILAMSYLVFFIPAASSAHPPASRSPRFCRASLST